MSEVADRIKTLSQFYLHSPSDLAQSFVAYAERIQKEDGITYGCILDNYMTPLRPGNTMAVVARPGHGKSSFMAYLMRREARAIIDRGKVGQECVYYVGWDQPAEETDAFFQANGDYTSSDLAWGRADIDAIRRNAIQRVHLPIYHISYSQRHAGIKRPPAPTMDDVYDLIHYNTYDGEKKLTPTLIVLDYIQKIPVGKGMKRVDAVTEATFQATELASRIGCPLLIGVQANRDVDDKRMPIPSLASAQWASAIEQEADKQIGLWRPRKTHSDIDNPTVKVNGTDYTNDEDLFVVKLLKQRFERGFGVWAIRFKPQTLEVYDYDKPREVSL
jgi:replicative DNA helicase